MESDQRAKGVNDAVMLLESGTRVTRIQRHLQKTYGVSRRAAFDWVNEARRELAADMDMTIEDLRQESRLTYLRVMELEAATPADIIRARNSIDKLFGLEAPARHELSGVGGRPIEMQVSSLKIEEEIVMKYCSPEEIEFLHQIYDKIENELRARSIEMKHGTAP